MDARPSSQRPLAVACCLSLLGFGLLAAAVTSRHALGWDSAVTDFVRPLAAILPDRLDGDVLLNGTAALCGLVLAVAIVALLCRRQFVLVAFVVAAVGGTLVLDPVLKAAFRRPAINPADHGYSFPSGSAMVTAAAVAALVLLARDVRWRVATVVVGVPGVVLYGIAIVGARWHYPSDVVGGWAVATAWVSAIWLLAGRRHPAVSGSPAIGRGSADPAHRT